MARRSLIFLAAGALLAAGCFGAAVPPPPDPSPLPPPVTQACGQSFAGAGHYTIAFYNLGQANTGFVTADGFVPVRYPDGRTVWWMSDTTTGTSYPDNTVANRGGVHNSTVEQNRSCLAPGLGALPQSGSAWHWPGSVVVVGNTLNVFSYKVVSAPGPPGLDWAVLGTAVSTFALPSGQLIGGPSDVPALINQESGENIPFGIRSFYNTNDVMMYLYGSTGSLFTARTWLGRAPAGQETNVGAWQFSADPPGTWSTNFADAKPIPFLQSDGVTSDGPPIAQLSVVPYKGGYLAGAFIWDTVTPYIGAWTAANPWGPWVNDRPTSPPSRSERTTRSATTPASRSSRALGGPSSTTRTTPRVSSASGRCTGASSPRPTGCHRSEPPSRTGRDAVVMNRRRTLGKELAGRRIASNLSPHAMEEAGEAGVLVPWLDDHFFFLRPERCS